MPCPPTNKQQETNMPQRKYTKHEKKQARRLLLIHNGDVGIVHQLTTIPKRTLYRWRTAWDDQYDLFLDVLAQKNSVSATANQQPLPISSPTSANDSELAQPPDSLAQFTQLRHILMEHVMTLANNLLIGDYHINNRVIALSRLIDRIVLLDQILPDQNPEKVVRFEFISDGTIYNTPPWEADTDNIPPTQDEIT
jgi:hypothetical protein